MSSHPPPNFLTCPAVPELEPPTEHPLIAPTEPPPQLLPPKKHWGHWLVIIVSVICVVVLGWFLYGVGRLGFAAYELKTASSIAKNHITAGNFIEANQDLERVQLAIDGAENALNVFQPLRGIPFFGRDIRLLEDAVQIGRHVFEGGRYAIHAAASFEEALQSAGVVRSSFDAGIAPTRRFQDLSPQEKKDILGRLQGILPELRLAREKFVIAADAWNLVPEDERSAPLMAPLRSFGEQLPRLQRQADQGIAFLELFIPLAGYPTENRFLLLLQNSDEMRPTGGFIGTVGYLRVESADIKDLKFEDVYSIDNPVSGVWNDVPPEPLRRQLGVKAWYLRDRNWSPDFPSSAQDMMQVYLREKTLPSPMGPNDWLSGVIAFEPQFFEELLRFVGPLTVEGKTFTADNFFDQLQYDSEIGFLQKGIPVERRKDIVLKIGEQLTQRLMSQPAARWGDLLDLMTQSLDQKHVLFYIQDPTTLRLLDQRNWTGRAHGSDGDYLWVIDANLAALKTDGVMDKQIRYSVDASSGTATVTLTYKNNTKTIDWRHTRYRDYARIYVPEGSELISSEGAMAGDISQTGGRSVPGTVDIMHELGKTVFGAFWSIEPGRTGTLRFTYRLPPAVVESMKQGEYRLLVQKQPGTETRLTLDHAFGKNIRAAVPGESPNQFGDRFYRVSFPLKQDQSITVKY